MPLSLDVLIDLSQSNLPASTIRIAAERWIRADSLGDIAGRVRIVATPELGALPLPARWSVSSGRAPAELGAAAAAAASRGVDLLVVSGAVDVSCEALGVLHRELSRDPMFGAAIPRVACSDGCCVARLTPNGAGRGSWLPRRIFADLPDSEVLVETVNPCVLIARTVVANFDPVDAEFEGLPAAVLQYLAAARRCGFRAVLCNRAVVSVDGLSCDRPDVEVLPAVSAADARQLSRLVPDLERSWQQYRGASWERFETLATAAKTGRGKKERPSLLLDVRNVGAVYNGTTQAALRLTDALREVATDWDISLFANPQGARFHDFARTYPGWPVHTDLPDTPFTVAFRPSQPWHIQDLVDLHRVSMVNVCLMLDTISWDIAYYAPPHLDGVWQFLADQADGLLYDSEFTRQRFLERFPAGAAVPGCVTHFSFDSRDYVRADAQTGGAGDFILVMGNHLDHKDVRQTVTTLASAFPYRHIKALAATEMSSPFVTTLQSGTMADVEIHRLYANARCVVYPSFYEGFGFPVLTALAYGRTVLARRSALLEELSAHCESRGRLVAYESREELVDLLGRLLHGEAVPEMPLGVGRTAGPPRSWRDAARETQAFLDALVSESPRRRWITRERAIRQLVSYRSGQ